MWEPGNKSRERTGHGGFHARPAIPRQKYRDVFSTALNQRFCQAIPSSQLGGRREEVRTEVQGIGFIGGQGEFVGVMAW